MAKAKKKVKAAKKKSVAVKNLTAKGTKSTKRAMVAVRRRTD